MKIGIAGTGRMGTAIAQRLIRLGHDVRVWNRTAARTEEARAAGAAWAPTLADLVGDSQVVISFLLDNDAVERVYLGGGGILAGSVEGRLFIDMSTVSPGLHERIAPGLASRDALFVECPVSGSIAAVLAGSLVGFAAGEASAFARAKPLLAQLCRRVDHVGALGAGARMKLAANLLLAVFWQALGESLLLVDPHSTTDAARAIDLLGDSNIAAGILHARAPQIIAGIQGDVSGVPAFDIDTMRKDLRYMAQEAVEHGSFLPLANSTLECFDRASREGRGNVDSVAYPGYWIARQKARARSQELPPAA